MIKLFKSLTKIISLKGFLSFLFILTINTTTVLGQGIIKGIITDAEDNVPMVAATVSLKGTTIGTVTDFNGEYLLTVKAGTHTLVISYLGYDTKEMPITVEDNQTVVVNESLSLSTFTGEVVIVTAQARGQLSAVNQQLRSNQIINVVSEERIRELPDENAAQAISRLPGIHLDGSKVVIRGLEAKMNRISINGIDLPSTEQNTRATDLGIISANMLSGIEVYKTLTPDMDADAIGGLVNLRFREAQPGLHYSITSQGAYNQQEKIFGGLKLWGDVSNRFFNDKLGVILNLNYETKYGGDDWITVGYSEFESGEIGKGKYIISSLNVYDQLKTTENIGGSMVLDYEFLNGQLLFTSMLSHSTPEETEYRDDMSLGANYHFAYLSRDKYTDLLLNNSLRLEQQFGIVKLNASISNVSVDRKYDFRYRNRFKDFSDPLPYYIDSITDEKRLRMEPWNVYDAINPLSANTARYYETTLIPTNYDENQWLADLDLQIPLHISDNININFKFGGKYIRKERNYDEELLIDYYPNAIYAVNFEIMDWLESQGIENDGTGFFFRDIRDYDYKPNEGFMNNQPYYLDWVTDVDFLDEMWLHQVNLDRETTNLLSDSRDARNDYWGWEAKTAGYAMAEINLGKRLTIIPGLRFEHLHNEYSSYKISQGTQWIWQIRDTLTRPADHNNLLPHLHIRFRATNWWDIRFSYNKTLSRPDYNYTVPIVYYHEIDGSSKLGNPGIRPAVSENFDANFTFYSRKMGLFTIGGYMKQINDIFYMQPTLVKNIPDTNLVAELPIVAIPSILQNTQDYYLNSPYTAYIKGMELEWQSNFSWLPEPFNGIVLNANYTHVWSETKYMQDRIRYERVPGSFIPKIVEVDTFYVNRLLHQANDIANVSLGYDWKGLSARLSFRFQGNVISRIGTRPEENEYTRDIYAYDFVIKQNIPVKFGQFEIFLNAINFTNVPRERYRTFYNYLNTQVDKTTYERYTGRQFQLGLRFKY